MAKKAFFSNKTKRDRTETARKIDSKNKRKYYLIVCEGEKTEPNYFKSLKNALPKGVLEICEFNIDGTGYNTESLVKKERLFSGGPGIGNFLLCLAID